jgi:hypothetical protein
VGRFLETLEPHKPKQVRIAAYGNFLREATRLEETLFYNPTPYGSYLSESTYCHLDTVKQRNFYVDFVDSRFRRPEASEETSAVLDFLFSFAEERADSFGSWHVTAQRSLDFLSVSVAVPSAAGKLLDIGFNDWASTDEPIEVAADLIRLLCYHGSAQIPNYHDFHSACESFLSKKSAPERVTLLQRAVSSLKHRMKIEALRRSGIRAFLMFKLLFGYAAANFSDREREEIFPDDVCESSAFDVPQL